MMQENQRFNVSPLLLSPRHHHKQIVLHFPRNFWDISSHMVHIPFSRPPLSLLQYMLLSLSLFSASNVLFYTGHKHILGFWRCVSSQPIAVRSCCAYQPMTEEWGWSHQASMYQLFFIVPHLFLLSSSSHLIIRFLSLAIDLLF